MSIKYNFTVDFFAPKAVNERRVFKMGVAHLVHEITHQFLQQSHYNTSCRILASSQSFSEDDAEYFKDANISVVEHCEQMSVLQHVNWPEINYMHLENPTPYDKADHIRKVFHFVRIQFSGNLDAVEGWGCVVNDWVSFAISNNKHIHYGYRLPSEHPVTCDAFEQPSEQDFLNASVKKTVRTLMDKDNKCLRVSSMIGL